MKKRDKIIYWVTTGLLSFMMLFSAAMYFLKNDMVTDAYLALGYPVYLIYPLAIAKILGVIAILSRKSQILLKLAYVGFFYVSLLAVSAHVMVNDGAFAPSLVALVLVIVSYTFERKVYHK